VRCETGGLAKSAQVEDNDDNAGCFTEMEHDVHGIYLQRAWREQRSGSKACETLAIGKFCYHRWRRYMDDTSMDSRDTRMIWCFVLTDGGDVWMIKHFLRSRSGVFTDGLSDARR